MALPHRTDRWSRFWRPAAPTGALRSDVWHGGPVALRGLSTAPIIQPSADQGLIRSVGPGAASGSRIAAGQSARREDVPSSVELRWRPGDVQAASLFSHEGVIGLGRISLPHGSAPLSSDQSLRRTCAHSPTAAACIGRSSARSSAASATSACTTSSSSHPASASTRPSWSRRSRRPLDRLLPQGWQQRESTPASHSAGPTTLLGASHEFSHSYRSWLLESHPGCSSSQRMPVSQAGAFGGLAVGVFGVLALESVNTG